jgi:hypothetical protein
MLNGDVGTRSTAVPSVARCCWCSGIIKDKLVDVPSVGTAVPIVLEATAVVKVWNAVLLSSQLSPPPLVVRRCFVPVREERRRLLVVRYRRLGDPKVTLKSRFAAWRADAGTSAVITVTMAVEAR